MSIGNNIYKLRAEKNLSQGELADILDVSRQSVSKWETDTAVPDLDKLIRLCDFFEVSLDEIVGRKADKPETPATLKSETKGSSTQRAIGYILFAFSLPLGFYALLFERGEVGYLIILPIALSFMLCGLLCLFAGKRAFYWCLWTIFAPLNFLSPRVVILSVATMNVIMVVVMIIMSFIAYYVFNGYFIKTSTKKTVLLIGSWFLPIIVNIIHIHTLTKSISPRIAYNILFSIALNFVCYILIVFLETYTVCYFKNLRKKNMSV